MSVYKVELIIILLCKKIKIHLKKLLTCIYTIKDLIPKNKN